MEIREAVVKDVDQIALLYSEQFGVMADLLPYLNQRGSQSRQFIEDSIINDDSRIFIAEDDTGIIGFVSVFAKESAKFDFRVQHKYAYVMDIITTKKYRGKGIATRLMDKVKKWAKERNLDYIELSVLANNPAVEFYKKLHFEESVRTMIYKL